MRLYWFVCLTVSFIGTELLAQENPFFLDDAARSQPLFLSATSAPLDDLSGSLNTDVPGPDYALPALGEELKQDAYITDPFHDYPESDDTYVPYQEPGYVDYLIDQRNRWSEVLETMGRRLDHYLSGERFQIEENDSYAILRAGGRLQVDGPIDPDFDLKFRVDLPGTKKRYRVVLQYDDDNTRSLEERSRASESVTPTSREQKSLFAGLFRDRADAEGKWETKFTGGVKVKFPPDPFVRASGVRYLDIASDWNMQIRGQAEWFNSTGFHGDVDFILDTLVLDDRLFRSMTLLDWREELDTLEYGQIFSLFKTLSVRDSMEYQLGAFGTGFDYAQLNVVYLNAIYRSILYKDWFYMTLIPELSFPREEDFKETFALTVSFEVHFR